MTQDSQGQSFFERCESLFHEALEIDTPEDRARFLEALFESDPKLAETVRALLSELDETPDFLEEGHRPLVPPAQMDFPAPPSAQERYESEGESGRGGFGSVHLACDRHMERKVAFKQLEVPRNSPNFEKAAYRFKREIRITAKLQHPNIVPIYEFGQKDDGTPFYTMRFIEGRTLEAALLECSSLEERLRYLRQLLAASEAVAYAHARGVIHRDLKPRNIMVGDFGETQVVDWGLSKHQDEPALNDATLSSLHPDEQQLQTLAGAVMGTPGYMSPEQQEGQIDRVDARSDVFSLGAILFRILAGCTPPREGSLSAELVRLGLTTENELIAVVARATGAPSQRYKNAEEFASELKAYLEGRRVAAYAYGLGELLARWIRRRAAPVAIGTFSLLALLAVGAQLIIEGRRATRSLNRLATQTAQLLIEPDPTQAMIALRNVQGSSSTTAYSLARSAHLMGSAQKIRNFPPAWGVPRAISWSPSLGAAFIATTGDRDRIVRVHLRAPPRSAMERSHRQQTQTAIAHPSDAVAPTLQLLESRNVLLWTTSFCELNVLRADTEEQLARVRGVCRAQPHGDELIVASTYMFGEPDWVGSLDLAELLEGRVKKRRISTLESGGRVPWGERGCPSSAISGDASTLVVPRYKSIGVWHDLTATSTSSIRFSNVPHCPAAGLSRDGSTIALCAQSEEGKSLICQRIDRSATEPQLIKGTEDYEALAAHPFVSWDGALVVLQPRQRNILHVATASASFLLPRASPRFAPQAPTKTQSIVAENTWSSPVAMTEDRAFLLSGDGPRVHVWSAKALRAAKSQHRFSESKTRQLAWVQTMASGTTPISALVIAPDRWVVTASTHGEVRWWDWLRAPRSALRPPRPIEPSRPEALRGFSLLASRSDRGSNVWGRASKSIDRPGRVDFFYRVLKEDETIAELDNPVHAHLSNLALSPRGDALIAQAFADGLILWEIESSTRRRLPAPPGSAAGLVELAVGSLDAAANRSIWAAQNFSQRQGDTIFLHHRAGVWSVAGSRSGRLNGMEPLGHKLLVCMSTGLFVLPEDPALQRQVDANWSSGCAHILLRPKNGFAIADNFGAIGLFNRDLEFTRLQSNGRPTKLLSFPSKAHLLEIHEGQGAECIARVWHLRSQKAVMTRTPCPTPSTLAAASSNPYAGAYHRSRIRLGLREWPILRPEEQGVIQTRPNNRAP